MENNLHQQIIEIFDSFPRNKSYPVSYIVDEVIKRTSSDKDIRHNVHAVLEEFKKKGLVEHDPVGTGAGPEYIFIAS